MNMKSNVAQYQCIDKFKDLSEQPDENALIQEIEKREFDLGLAPDDAYVKGVDFFVAIDGLVDELYGEDAHNE